VTALALDVGDRRIGVAISDPTRLLARPLTVLARRSNQVDAATIRQLADEHDATTIVVGIPYGADDDIGPQAQKTLAFARYLRRHLPFEVATWDERLSTQDAERELIAQGARRARRRELLDAAAAAVILGDWLSSQPRPSGSSP
jgi:putative holliday junction resolvase